MTSCVTEAIILRTRDYGESDRLVTFCTRTGGNVVGIAKGARRSRKRFVHAFEPCSLVHVTYRPRRTLAWVEACRLMEPHLELRTELLRWAYAAVAAEMMVEMVPEGESQEDLFWLFKETIERLAAGRDELNVVLLFVTRFMDLLGYLPDFGECSRCRLPLRSATRWGWRMREGAVLCPEHHGAEKDTLRLDLGTMLLIQQVRELPLDRIWRLHLRESCKPALLHGFLDWVRSEIRKDLKSLKLLDQVRSA